MKKKIIVVEDERIIAIDLMQLFQSEGYEIISIENTAESALVMINKEKPDLVVIDIMLMGKMDGISLAQEISKIGDIPIIYVTAYNEKKIMDRAMKTKPIAYIMKPILDEDLMKAVNQVLK